MTHSERLRIALRYTFPSGRGHLSTFLSSLSMLGLVLAIGLLIVVLSVMNGFDKEMRERILALVPHVTVYAHAPLADWGDTAGALARHPEATFVAPFVEFDTLILRGGAIETGRGIGLEVGEGAAGRRLLAGLDPEALAAFSAQPEGLVLGSELARRLGASPGQRLTLVVPAGDARGGAGAHFESVVLSTVLETGTELDQVLVLVHLPLAASLAGHPGAVSGFRVTTVDIFDVQRIGWELVDSLPPGFYATNWMMTHGNLYAAIQLSRDLVSILLFSIIAVAAFNVVSSLVLVVLDKRGNIAILRTLGASGRDIGWIFVLQGAMIGAVGVVLGSVVGALGSLSVPGAVAWLEGLLDIRFLDTDVYPVSFVPVDLLARDLLLVGGVALAMCVLAAIYPARRAARLAPALVLNQER